MASLGTALIAYAILRVTCPGPVGPRLLLSIAFGLIAAGVVSFVLLLHGR